jgi:hypothetical protein
MSTSQGAGEANPKVSQKKVYYVVLQLVTPKEIAVIYMSF